VGRAGAVLEGSSPLAVLAAAADAPITLVDAGLTAEVPGALARRVRAGSGAIDAADALGEMDVLAAVALGRALVDEAVDGGADLLVPAAIGVDADLPAVVTTAVYSGREPIFALGFDATTPDAEWIRRCRIVRDALRRTKMLSRDPYQILQTVGSIDLAVLVGVLLQAAGRRTPVLLAGAVNAAAALLAMEAVPNAQSWWYAPQHAPVNTERVAWDTLTSTAVVPVELWLGEGCGALAVLPLLQNALRLFGARGVVAGDG
jgi:nicotinate-nucleotide--dimethylbenzimidazole phosphoribosyltransferase